MPEDVARGRCQRTSSWLRRISEKSKILDEAEKRTGLERKYLIKKLKSKSNLDKDISQRKKRKVYYDGYLREALVQVWRIFDYLCGQRLEPLLKTETDRLRELGELNYSDELKRTINRKLDLLF